MTNTEIRPFRIDVAQAAIDDLRDRLANTRWPGEVPGVGDERGVPTAYLRELTERWATKYDWREQEAKLNEWPQFTTEIDGQTIHFAHLRSENEDALPLLLIHGWPGSFLEFAGAAETLLREFHLVIPSIPGFGFSMPLSSTGWTHQRCATAYVELMHRLGYDRYGVQGGDVGAFQGPLVAALDSDHVIGVHVNALVTFPMGEDLSDLTEAEQQRMQRFEHFNNEQMGYLNLQGTRPWTVQQALHDSPAGQLAWIAEKFREWSDPDSVLDDDTILTDVSLYWFTGTAGTSANLYYETYHDPAMFEQRDRGTVPTAVAVSLTSDVTIRRLADRDHTIVRWTEFERGGHFLALEQPEAYAEDVTAFFTGLGRE